MIEILLFAIASAIIARYLERSKYVAAMICHAVLFTVAFAISLLASEWEPLVTMFTSWMGENVYEFVHSTFKESASVVTGAFSIFFLVEIVALLSIALAATIAIMRGYKKLLAKIRLRKPRYVGYLIPTSDHNDVAYVPESTWDYLALGQLRN